MKKTIQLYTYILAGFITITSATSLANPSIIMRANYGSCPSVQSCDDPKHPILEHHHCITNDSQNIYKGTVTITFQGSTFDFPISIRPGLTDFYDCAAEPVLTSGPIHIEYDFSLFKLIENYDLLDHAPYTSPFVTSLTLPPTK